MCDLSTKIRCDYWKKRCQTMFITSSRELLVNLMSALNLQGQKTAIHPSQTKAMTAFAKNIPICRLRAHPANFINIGVNRSLSAIRWLPGVKDPYEGSL